MDVFDQVRLYWHTLKYLRVSQIYSRIRYYLWRPKINLLPPPPLTQPSGKWVAPAERRPSMTAPRVWLLLGESGHLDELGWDGSQREKLWRYNQHYFDDLNAKGAADRQDWHSQLLSDWIADNSPGVGTGWEPYPLSLRVVNLIKWATRGVQLQPAIVHSLSVQVRWLSERLEYHLLGNHLFANAKALVMAGVFFEGPEADKWLATGLGILQREIPEQVLSDGGHFERSTMYHALVMEDMLDLINITRRYSGRLSSVQREQVAEWPALTQRMLNWLKAMCLGDGEISFFNDAAIDIAPCTPDLEDYARRLISPSEASPPPLLYLKDSGYVRIKYDSAILLLDVARIGPDYLPGHAHADTLSFELSLGKQRVLVNSGISQYGSGKERLRQRGTAAHNTVAIKDHNSSEVWSGFRVARRAYPVGLNIQQLPDASTTEIRCGHDGYTRLSGRPMHYRQWSMGHGRLTVTDQMKGAAIHAEARFHFHPSVEIKAIHNSDHGWIEMPSGQEVFWRIAHGRARFENSTWHPRFGEEEPNFCLVVQLIDGASTVHFSWKDK